MKIQYLGLDIGGAHIKLVGLNKTKQIVIVEYLKYYFWNKSKNFLTVIKRINKYIDKKTLIGITMTAELCDLFKTRKQGFNAISSYCKNLKSEFFFYSLGEYPFVKKAEYKNVISMNWHAIGSYVSKKISNCIIIDFGSTTTDLICIKNNKVINVHFDDFSRLNNLELLYSGLVRTPIFGISNEVEIDNKTFKVIPEIFSNMADIYRINNSLKLSHDIDDTADLRSKSYFNSLCRVSRNFGIDYETSLENLIVEISEGIINKQLSTINNSINILRQKYNLNQEYPIITSGIGKDILIKLLKPKKCRLLPFDDLITNSSDKLKTMAALHAPAFSVAHLLSTSK